MSFPGRRAFEAALAHVHGELPDLFSALEVRVCPPELWPAGAPHGAVAVFEVPRFVTVLATPAPAAFFAASLAHEAQHYVQWIEAGRPAGWRASDEDEADAEEFGQAMGESYARRAR